MAVNYPQPSDAAGGYDYGPVYNKPNMYIGMHFILDSYFMKNRTNLTTPEVYVAALLQAVQLRFMDLEDLNVLLFLVGITYPTADDEQHFMMPDGALIEPSKALRRLSYYPHYVDDFKNSKADIIFVITGRNVYDPYEGEEEQFIITGSARHASVCGPNRIGIGEDDGRTFSGIGTVAQQTARLLGALSDGRRPCRKGDGYLMSNNYGKTKRYNLSKCSKEWLMYYYHYANDKFWACWNDKPHPMIEEPKYPSEVMDVCEARHSWRGAVKICSENYDEQTLEDCREMCCVDYPDTTQHFVTVAFDGANCGSRGVCISGECIERA